MATTFSHSFLLWKESALKIHFQNHPNPVLSVVTVVQTHQQCRVCTGLYAIFTCTGALSDRENHYLSYSSFFNVQHILQPPNLFFYFSLSIIFLCSLLYSYPLIFAMWLQAH